VIFTLELIIMIAKKTIKTNPIKSGYQDQCPDNPCEKTCLLEKLAANGYQPTKKPSTRVGPWDRYT